MRKTKQWLRLDESFIPVPAVFLDAIASKSASTDSGPSIVVSVMPKSAGGLVVLSRSMLGACAVVGVGGVHVGAVTVATVVVGDGGGSGESGGGGDGVDADRHVTDPFAPENHRS